MLLRRLFPLILALGIGGCGRQDATVAGNTTASPNRTPQVLRLGNGAEPQDLDPQAVTGVTEYMIVTALFEGLVSENPVDLSPVPALAERWVISPDGKTYTFHLRPGIKWSDGTPITSSDFIQSYQRILSPAFASEYAYLFYDYVVGAREFYDGKVKDFASVGFKAIDERTLEVSIKQPTPHLLKIMAHHSWMPVPVKVITRLGGLDQKRTGWTKPGNLVGSGPFVLKEWLPDQKIVVTRSPTYWDAATVKLDAIEFHPVTDSATEERMFRTGALDKTYELPAEKIEVYRREYPQALRIEPYAGVYYYLFNVSRPPLNDRRVRRALALAIDRESLVKNVTRGSEQPAYAFSYPGIAGYTASARLAGDLAEARRLLAEAGYPEGRGMPPIELLYNTSDRHRAPAEAIQAMWKQNLGVDLRLSNQEWKVFLDMTQDKNFTLARFGWVADYVDPNPFMEIWETSNGNNRTNWSNAEYDRLYAQALAAQSETARFDLFRRMDAILVEELPAIPIFYYTRFQAISPRVKGWHANLLDHHPYKHVWLEGN